MGMNLTIDRGDAMSHGVQFIKAADEGIYEGLRLWLVMNTSEALEIDPATMDTDGNLEELGLDPLQGMCIAGYLEEWLGFKIPATVLEDHPTIESACDYIIGLIPESDRGLYSSVASGYILEMKSQTDSRPSERDFRGFILTAP
jgi:acyl carrier protein